MLLVVFSFKRCNTILNKGPDVFVIFWQMKSRLHYEYCTGVLSFSFFPVFFLDLWPLRDHMNVSFELNDLIMDKVKLICKISQILSNLFLVSSVSSHLDHQYHEVNRKGLHPMCRINDIAGVMVECVPKIGQ